MAKSNVLYPRITIGRTCNAGAKKLLGYYPIAPGYRFSSLRGYLEAIGVTVSYHKTSFYDFGIGMLPVPDVETFVSEAATLSDSSGIKMRIEDQVMKELGSSQTEAEVTASSADDDVQDAITTSTGEPMWVPGEHALRDLQQDKSMATLFKRRSRMSLANRNGIYFTHADNSQKCLPVDSARIRSRFKMTAKYPSFLVAWASVPDENPQTAGSSNDIFDDPDPTEDGTQTGTAGALGSYPDSWIGKLLLNFQAMFDDPTIELRDLADGDQDKARMLQSGFMEAGHFGGCNTTFKVGLSFALRDMRARSLHVSTY